MKTPTSTRPVAPPAKPTQRQSPKLQKGRWIVAVRIALLTLVALLILSPVLWAVSTSLREPAASFQLPPSWLPTEFMWSNYAAVFERVHFGNYFLNSIIVTLFIAVGQMGSAVLAGYAFARFDFPLKKTLFAGVLATMMVPVQVTIIPVFVIIKDLGLSDTLLALILPAFPTAFGTFLMRQYFLSQPRDWEEAGMLDGASPWRIFRSIYLPLSVPGLAVIGVLAFTYHWNEFFRPLIFLDTESNFTLPLGLVSLRGELGTGSISVVLAGVVMSMIPAILVFIFGQRYLREGISAGGTK